MAEDADAGRPGPEEINPPHMGGGNKGKEPSSGVPSAKEDESLIPPTEASLSTIESGVNELVQGGRSEENRKKSFSTPNEEVLLESRKIENPSPEDIEEIPTHKMDIGSTTVEVYADDTIKKLVVLPDPEDYGVDPDDEVAVDELNARVNQAQIDIDELGLLVPTVGEVKGWIAQIQKLAGLQPDTTEPSGEHSDVTEFANNQTAQAADARALATVIDQALASATLLSSREKTIPLPESGGEVEVYVSTISKPGDPDFADFPRLQVKRLERERFDGDPYENRTTFTITHDGTIRARKARMLSPEDVFNDLRRYIDDPASLQPFVDKFAKELADYKEGASSEKKTGFDKATEADAKATIEFLREAGATFPEPVVSLPQAGSGNDEAIVARMEKDLDTPDTGEPADEIRQTPQTTQRFIDLHAELLAHGTTEGEYKKQAMYRLLKPRSEDDPTLVPDDTRYIHVRSAEKDEPIKGFGEFDVDLYQKNEDGGVTIKFYGKDVDDGTITVDIDVVPPPGQEPQGPSLDDIADMVEKAKADPTYAKHRLLGMFASFAQEYELGMHSLTEQELREFNHILESIDPQTQLITEPPFQVH